MKFLLLALPVLLGAQELTPAKLLQLPTDAWPTTMEITQAGASAP